MNQNDHWFYTLREWNSEHFKDVLINAFDSKPKIVYDIGACVGGWTQVASQTPGAEESTFFLFEPFIENYEYILEARLPRSVIDNFGIYYGKTESKAYWRGANIGGIWVDEIDTTNRHEKGLFKLKTLEELGYPKPDLIKLDVEGAEKNIIENSTIIKETPQIILEWHFGTENPIDYLQKHLPHKIIRNVDNTMFLLRL